MLSNPNQLSQGGQSLTHHAKKESKIQSPSLNGNSLKYLNKSMFLQCVIFNLAINRVTFS